MLIFSDRMRTGAFMAVWSVAMVLANKMIQVRAVQDSKINQTVGGWLIWELNTPQIELHFRKITCFKILSYTILKYCVTYFITGFKILPYSILKYFIIVQYFINIFQVMIRDQGTKKSIAPWPQFYAPIKTVNSPHSWALNF